MPQLLNVFRTLMALAIMFIGAYMVFNLAITPVYNKYNYRTLTCTIEKTSMQGGTSYKGTGGRIINVDSKECGLFTIRKSKKNDLNILEVNDYIKAGKVYKFDFGDIQPFIFPGPPNAQSVYR